MIASIVLESIYSATSEGTNDNSDSSDLDSSKQELEPIADWSEYGDYEVWVAVREMLESLPRNSHRKLLQQETEEFPRTPDTPITEGLKLMKAKNTKDTGSYEPLEKGADGLTLEKLIADMLLKGRAYFVHFPTVYCYDENRTIFRVGEGHRYQQVEVDQCIEDMKRHRAMQAKDGFRLSAVRCPVPGCGKTQRCPQALRDHLYFHFSIKPHRCDYGCAIAFETEAKKNWPLETCPPAAQWGTH